MKFLLFIFATVFYSVSCDLTEVCYDGYGCFTNRAPFYDFYARPIAVLPQSPEAISTKFYLYTRSNPKESVEITANEESDFFGPNLKTRFIIHGFLHTGFKPWVVDMKNAFLRVEDSNIIAVDWSKGNGFPYTQATANTQIVGAEIAKLVNSYISKGLITADDVHIIGHSLGSHIAGYAGERISPKIGRITGLDPAGPYFENTDVRVRLDPSDAQFVDAIHSDGTAVSSLVVGYGLLQKVGHVDFYPNGGKNQPKCPITTNKFFYTMSGFMTIDMKEIEDFVACGHIAAVYFFIDSIENKRCLYTAFRCSSIEEFNNGNCISCSSEGCNHMGFHASPDKEIGELYLSTQPADSSPYCLNHYQVVLTSADYKTKKQTKGKFSITLRGSLRDSDTAVIDDSETTFKEGLIVNRMVSTPSFLGGIQGATVSFTKSSCFFLTCWYDVDRWNFSDIKVFDGELQKIVTLCPRADNIISGGSVDFIPC